MNILNIHVVMLIQLFHMLMKMENGNTSFLFNKTSFRKIFINFILYILKIFYNFNLYIII